MVIVYDRRNLLLGVCLLCCNAFLVQDYIPVVCCSDRFNFIDCVFARLFLTYFRCTAVNEQQVRACL